MTPDLRALADMLDNRAALTGWPERIPIAAALRSAQDTIDAQKAEIERLEGAINTPELVDFPKAVSLEAVHQRERWGGAHDSGKAPEDWFWLLGYLAGKALHAAKSGNDEKALHHCVSSAAALANWHAAILGARTIMRPGIDPVERGIEP